MQLIENASVEVVKMHMCDIDQTMGILIETGLEYWGYNDFVSELQRPDSFAIVGKKKNKVIGFCIARLIMSNNVIPIGQKNNSNPQSDFSEQRNSITDKELGLECEIYNIAVKKEFQYRGVGNLLLKQLIQLSQEYKADSLWLEVRESNTPAISFYQKNNFGRMYVRKNFYSNPIENAIVMKRNLSSYPTT